MQIETALGGIWRYSMRLVATEPPPDDTITIQADGLNKETIVGFRLTSKSEYKDICLFVCFLSQNGTKKTLK